MEEFLSLIVFIFPGLIAFFWIQLFGVTPTIKYQGIEILALSAVLWIPINAIVLSGYNLIIWFANHLANENISKLYIDNFNTLSNLSSDFAFITYYVTSSIVASYFLARLISGKLYGFMLDKINSIRKKDNRAPLSKHTSVWDTMFSEDTPQIVKIMELADQNKFDIGELIHVSRTYESEKNIVLRETDLWKEIDENHNLNIDKVFYDIKAHIKNIVYDSHHCQEVLNDYHREREND